MGVLRELNSNVEGHSERKRKWSGLKAKYSLERPGWGFCRFREERDDKAVTMSLFPGRMKPIQAGSEPKRGPIGQNKRQNKRQNLHKGRRYVSGADIDTGKTLRHVGRIWGDNI